MTLKEQLVKYLLKMLLLLNCKASVAQAGGGTDFEVANKHAGDVITDFPTETSVGILQERALCYLFLNDLGKATEQVGSNCNC